MSNSLMLKKEHSQGFYGIRDNGKAKTHYDRLVEKAIDIRDKVKKNEGIAPSPVLSLLHNIVDGDLIDALYEYCISDPRDNQLPLHIISVTLGSLKVGKGMGYDTKKLLKLGLAAFFENVGMYKIPEHILQKEGTLSQDEILAIRRHPEMSAQILAQLGVECLWLAEVALQVHERSDGSGYPKGIRGEEIPEFASIIGLLDTYMAMIEDRPYRAKYIQSGAVRSIINISKGKFPPKVIKVFLDQISLFPVNTYVRLNNDSIGRVLSTEKSQPLRPTIELLCDGLGQKMEKPKIIHLSDSPLLHIVETIDEE